MPEPLSVWGTHNGLNLDNLDVTTDQEIDQFLNDARKGRGPLDPGPGSGGPGGHGPGRGQRLAVVGHSSDRFGRRAGGLGTDVGVPDAGPRRRLGLQAFRADGLMTDHAAPVGPGRQPLGGGLDLLEARARPADQR